MHKIKEKQAEIGRDEWFNQVRPMVNIKRTWREKRLAREENDSDEDSSCNLSGNEGKEKPMDMEVKMVFVLPTEFRVPEEGVAQLTLGAKRAVFEKPSETGQHLKPLYIKGHVNGKPAGHMLVDGGGGMNMMPLATFSKLVYRESELIRTNMNLSVFSGELSQAKGILFVELTLGNKTVPTAFFVVDVKGRYNVLLGHDWIHANGCVPSTWHQCLIQWVGDEVELVTADNSECVALTEASVDWQHGEMRCLTRRDLSKYDYVRVEENGFVPVCVKSASMARLHDMML